ncbi:MAG: leucyl aminopeptidase [Austwickia sp.]|nr:leucyl aminopeptidase [Austwickia sp.]
MRTTAPPPTSSPTLTPTLTPALIVAGDAASAADVDALVVFSRPGSAGSEPEVDAPPQKSRRRRRDQGKRKDATAASREDTDEPGSPVLALPDQDSLPRPVREHLEAVLGSLRAAGSAEEVTRVAAVPGVQAPVVLVVGLGDGADAEALSPDRLRICAGAAVRHLAGRPRVAILVPIAEHPTIAAVAEGAAMAAYDFSHHRSQVPGPRKQPPQDILVLGVGARDQQARADVARAAILAKAVAWARDLVNTGPNELYPASFAEAVVTRAATLSGPASVEVTVLDDQELREQGYGGIIGVGQGSAFPPRMVLMRYRPRGAGAHLAYVGKGITFDSGGLCIKPAGSMPTMKCDMAGAAAVAGAVLAAAELGIPVALTGVLALAENMPSSAAQRPGDVVTMGDGTTVEIINTDAEGRLVLADGLCLARHEEPDAVVDIATLTGACIIALGKRTAAVLANDDAFQGEVAGAATLAGEPIWPLPITTETRAGMDSLVADLKHTGEAGAGGVMVGAAFLREFAWRDEQGQEVPWAHLDIAGPAYNEGSAYGFTPKGGTGYGVRTLVALAEGRA